jgi:hypothetical protein
MADEPLFADGDPRRGRRFTPPDQWPAVATLSVFERTSTVTVTLLYFPGCPNWQTADANVRVAIEEADVNVVVHRQVVSTLEDAERLGFLGSPTVLLDGRDRFAEPGAAPGLSCRVYRTDAGAAGAPTVAQLRAALRAAH